MDVVPTGSREFFSLLPPFFMRETTFEEYQPGLYGLTQPLSFGKSFDVRLRMTVAKLGDGSLLVSQLAPETPSRFPRFHGVGDRDFGLELLGFFSLPLQTSLLSILHV